MNVDTLITNGQVVLEAGIARLDVGIRGNRIVVLTDSSEGISAKNTIDATDKLVLAGGN